MGNNHTVVLLAPVLACLFFMRVSKPILVRVLLIALCCAVAGCAVNLYLPVRSARNPLLDIGEAETFRGFIEILSRANYGSFKLGTMNSGRHIFDMAAYCKELIFSFGGMALLLSVLGVRWYRDNRRIICALCLGFVLTGPLFIAVARVPYASEYIPILNRFYAVPVMFITVIASYGFNGITIKMPRWRKLLFGLVFAGLLLPVPEWISRHNRRHCFVVYHYGRDLIKSIKTPAILFATGDTTNATLHYLLHVEQVRENVHLLFPGKSWWYIRQLTEKYRGAGIVTDGVTASNLVPRIITANQENFHIYSTTADMIPFSRSIGLVNTAVMPRISSLYFFQQQYNVSYKEDYFIQEILDRYPHYTIQSK
jgi:hypothetical protein